MDTLESNAPRFTTEEAVRLAASHYGFVATARSLPSHCDQNFALEATSRARYVLKIANTMADPDELDLQRSVLAHLSKCHESVAVQHLQPTSNGEDGAIVQASDGSRHWMWMVSYLPGRPLGRVRPHTPELLADVGRTLGSMDRALDGFAHPAMHRSFVWDLRRASSLRKYLTHIGDVARRSRVENFLEYYERDVVPQLVALRTGVIHNDANDYNLLVQGAGYDACISGIIDFGDVLHTHTVIELAIGATYAMLGKRDPLRAAVHLVRGYHGAYPLQAAELAVLYDLIVARLCSSILVSAFRSTIEPDNAYLQISEAPAWDLLETLSDVHPRFACYTFREACGLDPDPQAAHVVKWLKQQRAGRAAITQPDLRGADCEVLDLSVGSPLTGGPDSAPSAPSVELSHFLTQSQSRVAIGRYDEVRLFYTGDQFVTRSEERRTVHLGIDIFRPAGTPVFAPLSGVVHSFQDAGEPLGYGPVIILEHEACGTPCYTLYGHLSRASLSDIKPGRQFRKGDRIGTIGDTEENGGWVPHLHFQIITDLLGAQGDFPGVAAASERAVYTSICPDPNLLLGIPDRCFPESDWGSAQILERRARHIGRNLSISYRTPLLIVRGEMQYLYDDTGRVFLDAVNNVPHVGHSHPRVVQAARRQMAVLNTNTRYLHASLVRYAERLASLLSDPLSVCFFVNSGSEANDLALRLAHAHTGQRDVMVLDGAYHGHLSSLIKISPYKFDGPGGKGAPPHVHKVTRPDPYRAPTGQTGQGYAESVLEATRTIEQAGRGVAAFISESILGCAGQIEFPAGYLPAAYRYTRQAGGVCIADEVQVGFGRVGTHFWGFETQEVVPDIVVLGKPIGNGHPLGAVVTTPEIADSFDTGMEFFSTFGGNPVSCAVGMAVLDVIEEEGLQAHALRVGNALHAGLSDLQSRHQLIGDVRGRGLFLGVELVLDTEALQPATEQASYIVNRLCEHGVLVGTDGPFHNVLKIKPPLVFSEANADFLVETLDNILKEDFVRR